MASLPNFIKHLKKKYFAKSSMKPKRIHGSSHYEANITLTLKPHTDNKREVKRRHGVHLWHNRVSCCCICILCQSTCLSPGFSELQTQLPLNASWEAMDDDAGAWIPVNHMEERPRWNF